MALKLHAAWSQRLKLWKEGEKLRAEGAKRAGGNKLRSKGAKRAEGNKLWKEGTKLLAEGDKLWKEAVIEAYGNVTMAWSWNTHHGECTLENGDRYCEDESAGIATAA